MAKMLNEAKLENNILFWFIFNKNLNSKIFGNFRILFLVFFNCCLTLAWLVDMSKCSFTKSFGKNQVEITPFRSESLSAPVGFT